MEMARLNAFPAVKCTLVAMNAKKLTRTAMRMSILAQSAYKGSIQLLKKRKTLDPHPEGHETYLLADHVNMPLKVASSARTMTNAKSAKMITTSF